MPNTFQIRLEVEEVALGPVIRRLNQLAGIAKIDIDLGLGGTKSPLNGHGNGRANPQADILALLSSGPKSVAEIKDALGGGHGSKSRAYSALHNLRLKKLIKSAGRGMYQLSGKAAAELPTGQQPQQKTTPSGRVPQGTGRITLLAALERSAMSPGDIRARLVAAGISDASASGVLERGRRDGLIKKNAAGLYELTAKGQKTEAAHG